jgi:hypothetical protein
MKETMPLNLCITQLRPKILRQAVNTVICCVGIAIIDLTKHPVAISSSMIIVTANITDLTSIGSLIYLKNFLGGIMRQLRIVDRSRMFR